jgi:hypothetical protein
VELVLFGVSAGEARVNGASKELSVTNDGGIRLQFDGTTGGSGAFETVETVGLT